MMGTWMKRRKALAAAAALTLLAAWLPLAAMAAEEDPGEEENGVYEEAAEAGDTGDIGGAPAAGGVPEPGPAESSGGAETPPEPVPETEGPESDGEAGIPPEPAPENPGDNGEAEAPPEPSPEPEDPADGGESGAPPEFLPGSQPPEDGGEADAPLGDLPAEVMENRELPPAEPEVLEISLTPDTPGRVTLDGCLDDWAEVPEMAHGNDRIDFWKAARDLEGNVYLCFTGTAATPYDESYYYQTVIVSDGVNAKNASLRELRQEFAGAETAVVSEANVQSAAPYYLEAMIPAAYVSGEGCTLALGWESQPVPVAGLPVLNGENLPERELVYGGISIDGSFSDWDAVAKFQIHDTNPVHNNLDCAAFVFDGDVYIYIKEVLGGDAAAAGSHSNGNYAITTDLGRVLKFQLKKENGGTVYGVEGAEARHVGMQWEVRIPASELPYYRDSLSFGLYLAAASVSGVSDLRGGGGNVGSFTGIEIDGAYGDWAAYPHSVIEYATPGTQAPQTDSQGALYFEDGILYGHVMTTMPEHLDSRGGDFLSAIDIAFNGEREHKEYFEQGNFYPRMFTTDGSLVPDNTKLEPGVHTFLICDNRTLGDPDRKVFGTMKVTVDEDWLCDEMEFELDLKAVAESQGRSVNDLRTIEARFGRFGDWITISGASSGALLGVTLCCGVTAGTLLRRRKRGGDL